MKTMKSRLLIPLIAACVPMLFAETSDNASPAPDGPPPGGGLRDKMRDKMHDKMDAQLPPDLRERLESARKKALEDTAVQSLKTKADAASDEFRKAMREAMMKADPSLFEDIKAKMGDKFHGGKGGKRGEPPGFANLSDSDRKKLAAARETAKSDPAVQAAEAKIQSAKTPEERRSAMQDAHKAMKAALLKADPSLAPVLEQLKPPQGPPPGGRVAE